MGYRCLFGIELEMIYNPTKLGGRLPQGAYHSPVRLTNNWFAESDASVETRKTGWRPIEIISRPFKHEEFRTIMQDLITNVFKGNRMLGTCEFNDTCGNHVHVSVVSKGPERFTIPLSRFSFKFRGKRMRVPLTLKTAKEIRQEVLPLLSDEAKSRYFRSFAKQLTPYNYGVDRYSEWNIIDPRHVEYRSLNFVGIKNWDKLVRAYDKVFTIIEKHLLAPITDTNEVEISTTREAAITNQSIQVLLANGNPLVQQRTVNLRRRTNVQH